MREPTPTSRAAGRLSAAPPKNRYGGLVKIAFSSRYSQYPAKSRRDTVTTGCMTPGPPKDAITAGVPSRRVGVAESHRHHLVERGLCTQQPEAGLMVVGEDVGRDPLPAPGADPRVGGLQDEIADGDDEPGAVDDDAASQSFVAENCGGAGVAGIRASTATTALRISMRSGCAAAGRGHAPMSAHASRNALIPRVTAGWRAGGCAMMNLRGSKPRPASLDFRPFGPTRGPSASAQHPHAFACRTPGRRPVTVGGNRQCTPQFRFEPSDFGDPGGESRACSPSNGRCRRFADTLSDSSPA